MGLFNKGKNDGANLAIWQEMKTLQDNMDRSIFSGGQFYVTGDNPYYIEYIGFSTDYDAFRDRDIFLKKLYDGTDYDEHKESFCHSLIHHMFGENTTMPLSDRLIEEDITAEDLEVLRINYRLPSLRHWSSFDEAKKVISGFTRWVQKKT